MGTMTWTKTDNINRCASENCFSNAAWTMTSGGVSSDYCDECRTRIDPSPHYVFGTWYPIESAPKDGTQVDLWCRSPGLSGGGYARITDCWFSGGKWWRYDDLHGDDQCRSEVYNANFWMPHPPPPAKEG